jgi:SulP family sulfate permease
MEVGAEHLSAREKELLKRCGDDLILFRMQGPLSFGAAKGISERMLLVKQYRILLLDITDVPHLGVTASLAIERMAVEAKQTQRTVLVAGASGKVKQRLAQFGIEHLIDDRQKALNMAAKWLHSEDI